jgi:hypothetical protein
MPWPKKGETDIRCELGTEVIYLFATIGLLTERGGRKSMLLANR